ncbi:MAG: AAA family ATPase [Akkermansiaceae bacterium]|nr:AAA family ATPase [Akkermansiaceae bacterium]
MDLHFSEFTCVAGPNGAGKSNLFDAIQFLSLTASKTILEAALAIRGDGGMSSDPSHIFCFDDPTSGRRIDFRVEMIVPKVAYDDLNQEAQATFTFLVYELSIVEREARNGSSPMQIVREELTYHPWSKAAGLIPFSHSLAWRSSLMQAGTGKGRREFFISTQTESGNTVIQRHQDGGSRGKPFPALASNLPRTVLSTANASESPTALCAKREMESWRFLALEASSLRAPDDFNGPSMMDPHGRHMPATLNRLIQSGEANPGVADRIAQRLTELVENVKGIRVEPDNIRRAFSLLVSDHSGNEIPARGLSDGTLRFLALAIIEEDPLVTGVVCLEEPENGIHPKRLPAMIALLRDIAVDTREPCGNDNPLRQIIINTHSPSVVAEVSDDSLVIVVDRTAYYQDRLVHTPSFIGLPDTWRHKVSGESVARGLLLPYLNPIRARLEDQRNPRRVADRDDLQMLLPNLDSQEK